VSEHVRDEIKKLVERGNVTASELEELRCNSWEWEALVPALNDEAFVKQMQHAIDNCFVFRKRPFSTYNDAVEGLYAPELLRRFQAAAREARAFAETIDNVREALGQEATHYLVIADDVGALVEAVTVDRAASNKDSEAWQTLSKIRKEPGIGNPKCIACSIEAEIGTEEDPHPVPERFHTCSPVGAKGRKL
jgi:hypothetical protein